MNSSAYPGAGLQALYGWNASSAQQGIAQSQANLRNAANLQATACANWESIQKLANAAPLTPLKRAQRIAAEVRARRPEMQVKRLPINE